MHTRICRKYPITHVNIQEHLIYSNCHTPIYILKKKTHFHAQSVASNFTPNLYPKHLLSQTTYIHLKYTIQIFTVSLLFIYMHIGKLITSCTYLHSKKAFHTIIHSSRKTIIHTLLGISYFLYLPMYTHYCKVFSMLPLCKVSNMGQPKFEQKLSQENPNFHVFLTLKPNLSMFPCIEATSLGS